ncbi:hypothetical protein MHUMG1_09245 [Metarhizium humberi]|uniref:NAD(P)-binding domain protein n=1 Tax=Metarhizium humberi TaxID=2596975 RepID=A0A9P8S4A3_9HYPO|nr:hypothetical protein MHUMG1_09245 [Metarhizium humberi]
MAFGLSISAAPIAVISAGIIGPRHAKTVMKNNQAKLVAVVDSSPAGSALATELRVSNYTSVDNLLNSAEQVDVAIIYAPNHTHVHLATKFAYMMVEKPVSADVRSGQDLVNCLSSGKSKVLVGHHRRFNLYILKTEQVISTGKLGDVLAVRDLGIAQAARLLPGAGRMETDEAGGAILIDMIHEIGILHFPLGRIVQVHADRIPRQRGNITDKGAAMTPKFKSGAVGNVFSFGLRPVAV